MPIQLTLTNDDIEIIRKLPGVREWDSDTLVIRALVYAAIYEGWFEQLSFEKAMERAYIRRGPKKKKKVIT